MKKLLLFWFFLMLSSISLANVWYVDGDVSGSGNGTSWEQAFKTIEEGMNVGTNNGEVWVKKGTYSSASIYYPYIGEHMNGDSFIFQGFKIYGGFDGTEVTKSQRNLTKNITTVKHGFSINGENSLDVTVDGFTIDGGISAISTDEHESSFVLLVDNCTFFNNESNAIYSGMGWETTITINNSIFSNNSEVINSNGSYNYTTININNSTFSNNSTGFNIKLLGDGSGGDINITNSRFFNNDNLFDFDVSFEKIPLHLKIMNSTFYNNGGEFYGYIPTTITNSILWSTKIGINYLDDEDYVSVDYSNIQGGYTGTGNIDSDPMFINAAAGDFHLKAGSPAIDSGTSSGTPSIDIDGNPRPNGNGYDMGAYEFNEVPFSCSTQTEIPKTECDALVALYDSTNGDNWINNDGWKITNTPCNWHGIGCNNGYVSTLHLAWNQLTGTIPAKLGELINLSSLDLGGNQLTGIIPTELSYLVNLQHLGLGDNQLTGNIPAGIGNLINLKILWLNYNQLTGIILSELGNLTNLEELYLDKNKLTGTIPLELGNLTNLQKLHLEKNGLTGTIPIELGNLTNLREFYLRSNHLCTIDQNLIKFLDSKSSDWQENQTDTPCDIPVILNIKKGGTGNCTVTDSNINCGAKCSKSYPINSSVTLTATADNNSIFTGWDGACSGTDSCDITMNTDKKVTAICEKLRPLQVLKQGNGLITSKPSGINCGSDCEENYQHGYNVILTAQANSKDTFAGWQGAGCSGTGQCTIPITQAQTVTAIFNEPKTLTVVIQGNGSIKANGIDCKNNIGTCENQFSHNSKVSLIANSDPEWNFVSWTNGCGTTNPCTVEINESKNIIANFDKCAYFLNPLDANFDANGGTGRINVDSKCSWKVTPQCDWIVSIYATSNEVSYKVNENITANKRSCNLTIGDNTHTIIQQVNKKPIASFTASPDKGQIPLKVELNAIADDPDGTIEKYCWNVGNANGECVYEQQYDMTFKEAGNYEIGLIVVDNFGTPSTRVTQNIEVIEPIKPQITLVIEGNGMITGNITTCVSNCTEEFKTNTELSLEANPDTGWEFTGWKGDCNGIDNCSITMNSNKNITANFEPIQHQLTVSIDGQGEVTGNGIDCGKICQKKFIFNKQIKLTAIPNDGNDFVKWEEEDCGGTGDCIITMDSDKNVTAKFTGYLPPVISPNEIYLSPGETQIFIVSHGKPPYQWSFEGGNFTEMDGDQIEITAPKRNDTYILSVTDAKGNLAESTIIVDTIILTPKSPIVYKGETAKVRIDKFGGVGECDWSSNILHEENGGIIKRADNYIVVQPRTDVDFDTKYQVTCRDEVGNEAHSIITIAKLQNDFDSDGLIDDDEAEITLAQFFNNEIDKTMLFFHLEAFLMQ